MLQREENDLSRITILDTCRSSLSEMRGLADWLKKRQQATMIDSNPNPAKAAKFSSRATPPLRIALVSSPLHMRRIKYITETVFHDPTIRFYYLPVPLERYGWTHHSLTYWWMEKSVRTWVLSEIAKLVIFWLRFSW